MIIGIPTETKNHEARVGLLPVGAHLLSQDGHIVLVQHDAGINSGFTNEDYLKAGATLIDSAAELYDQAELIMKVKEPQPDEVNMLHDGQIVFGYFHFAALRELTVQCMAKGVSAVAYETLVGPKGKLPLLTPMSEVAGKLSIQEGAKALEKPQMGRGILLGGVPGVRPAEVLVLGAGVVGTNAATVAAGLGANVTIMDINLDRLRHLDEVMPANVTTVYCDPHAIEQSALEADLVIGAVLVPGDKAPRLLQEHHVHRMKQGSVVVDVCIDQGGCVETSRPTTHEAPTYVVDSVVHYCVTNMPGAVGRTSSQALCNATLPYARQLANYGLDGFLKLSEGHAAALNIHKGKITHPALKQVFSDLCS